MDHSAISTTKAASAHEELVLAPGEVQRRFAWARRRGQPQWLWPDVAIADWQVALAHVELALRAVLTRRAAIPTLDCDPVALGVAGYTSGVGPLIGHWIEQGCVAAAPAATSMLGRHLRHNRVRMQRLTHAATLLADALAQAGIDCTFLKGMHTAHVYFPNAGTRPAADIDILIEPHAQAAAEDVLRGAGFAPGRKGRLPRQQSWAPVAGRRTPVTLSMVHADDPWSVDLQLSLNRRYSTGAGVIRLDDVAGQSHRNAWPISGSARVLVQPLLLLHLATHASCGLNSLNMLRLVELHFVIARDTASGSLRWSDFAGQAERAGALGLVYPALRLTEELAPGTVPQWVLAESAARVPAAVRRIVDPLAPATAQRVVRCSLPERFMWTRSARAMASQILRDSLAPGTSLREVLGNQRTRMWRLVRGTVTG